jgi:hypothetical protein
VPAGSCNETVGWSVAAGCTTSVIVWPASSAMVKLLLSPAVLIAAFAEPS